MTFFQ